MAFQIKLPILEVTKYGESLRSKLSAHPLYGKMIPVFGSFKLGDNYGEVIHNWSTYTVEPESLAIYDNLVRAEVEEELRDYMRDIVEENTPYLIVRCPYTNEILSKRTSHMYGIFFNTKVIKLRVRDSDGELSTLKVKVDVLGDTSMLEVKPSDIRTFARNAEVSAQVSPAVFKLFQKEWGFGDKLHPNLVDLEIVGDSVDSVSVYYDSISKVESKRVYLDRNGNRNFKYKGKMIPVPSADIEHFDEKLRDIEVLSDLEYSNKWNEASSLSDKIVSVIEGILSSNDDSDEKLRKIREVIQ